MKLVERKMTTNKHELSWQRWLVVSILCALAIYQIVRSGSREESMEQGRKEPSSSSSAVQEKEAEVEHTDQYEANPTVKNVTKSRDKIFTRLIPIKCDSKSRGFFDRIYKDGVWGAKLRHGSDFYGNAQWPPAKKNSASGGGSELGYATETSLQIIRDTINKFDIKSMVDVPCGDVNWILDSFETDTLSLYVGLDVTRAVIEVNKQRFAHHNNKEFHFWDMTECVLPKFHEKTGGEEESFDLVHVRDVIQHLNLDQGIKYFCNIFKSGAKILITTTYDKDMNKNITEGAWYENDLTKEPFSFPKSENCVATHPNIERDFTCVYNLTEGSWVNDFISKKC